MQTNTHVSRRSFVAGAVSAGVASALGGAAIASADAPIATMTPGTYRAEGFGKWPKGSIEGARYGSPAVIEPTVVEVTVDETSILDVAVVQSSDTPDLVSPVIDRIPAAIVASQSINVDVVAGCTLTSACVVQLVRDCLEQAGADLDAFKVPVPRSTEELVFDADLCVVGVGGSGTTAALAVSEAGYKVVVLEKCGRIGGNTAWASGPMSVGSVRQMEAGSTRTADDLFTEWMEYSNWRCNAPLVHGVLTNSGPTLDWLCDLWEQTDTAGFDKVASGNGYDLTWAFSKGIAKFAALYEQILEPRGVELLMDTRAEHLLVNDEGTVCGVTATRQDGTKVTVNARAVVVGTGGYAGNPEMLERYVGSSEFYVKGMTTSSGDGIQMALEAGSALHNEMIVAMASACGNAKVDIYSGYLKYCNLVGALMVDPAGERFMNEELAVTHQLQDGGSAIRRAGHFYVIMTQGEVDAFNDRGFFGLMDQETIESLGFRPRMLVESMPTIHDELQQMLDAGEAWKAQSLEELAQIAPVDAEIFMQTVADYAEVCSSGEDRLFGKRPGLLRPLENGPFYAIRCIPAIDGTLNACRVSKTFRDIGKDLTPIPGLWVVGQDSGGYYSNPYTLYVGSTSCYALTSGRIAGLDVCEYLA